MKISKVSIFSYLLVMSLSLMPVNAQTLGEVNSLLKNSSAQSKLTDPIYKTGNKYKDIENNLVGHYTLSFGQEPNLNQKLLSLTKDRKYVLIGDPFSISTRIGDWRVVDGEYLHLLAYDTYPFNVYGRHSTDLNESSRVIFGGVYFDHNTLVHYGDIQNETPTLTPVFPLDADCRKRPYIDKVPEKYNSISFAYNPNDENKGDEEIDIYTFSNQSNFNDFYIVARINQTYKDTIKATVKEDYLVFEEGRTTKRFVPEATSEDDSHLQDMENLGLAPKTLYQNVAGKPFVEPFINPSDYTFDHDIKAYVAINKCSDNCPTEEEYNYSDVFYEYQLLEDITVRQSQFRIANESVINSVCEE